MKAPEKIYLFENPITEIPDDRWLSKRSDEKDVEYIRTDAFIAKVVKFLESTDFCQYYNKEFVNEFIRKMGE